MNVLFVSWIASLIMPDFQLVFAGGVTGFLVGLTGVGGGVLMTLNQWDGRHTRYANIVCFF